jgi:hypothetical protein
MLNSVNRAKECALELKGGFHWAAVVSPHDARYCQRGRSVGGVNTEGPDR